MSVCLFCQKISEISLFDLQKTWDNYLSDRPFEAVKNLWMRLLTVIFFCSYEMLCDFEAKNISTRTNSVHEWLR